jgi:CHRD domain-containing protein
MKKKPGKIVAALGIAAVTAGLAVAAAHDRHNRFEFIRAALLGQHETPSVSTPATGRFRAVIDEDSSVITFTLSYEGLSGPATVSHLHFGERHVAGGVMMWICGGGGQPACPADVTTAEITGTITPANVTGPTAQGIAAGEFAKALDAIRDGASYANVHSAKFPAGEIRGQVAR